MGNILLAAAAVAVAVLPTAGAAAAKRMPLHPLPQFRILGSVLDMKKLAGAVLFIGGLVFAIPAALLIMQMAGYVIQLLFDPAGKQPSFSALSISFTIFFIIIAVGLLTYGRKLWNADNKNVIEDSNNNDSSRNRP